MRKLVLLSIAALLVSLSVQAHTVIKKTESKINIELYNSIYSDFESYYAIEVAEESALEAEQDNLYTDLLNSFHSEYTKVTMVQEYMDEYKEDLYLAISKDFDKIYISDTIGEELEDNYNDQLYDSLYNSIKRN